MTTPSGDGGQDAGGASGGSRLLGVNQLQTGLDKLTQAIQGLSARLSGSGAASSSGANFTPSASMSSGQANGGGSSFGTGGTLNNLASGGNGGWGRTLGAAAGGFLGGRISSQVGSFGAASGQVGGQVVQSAVNQGGGFLATSGQQGISAYKQWVQAMGGNLTGAMNQAGLGIYANNLATGSADAIAGTSALYANSGNLPGTSLNARGVNMFGMSGGMGFANPGMSYAQNAAAVSAMYSNQFSMNMMQAGLAGSSPLKMGGGTTSSANVFSALQQRMLNTSGGVSSNKFMASMMNPNSTGYQNMLWLNGGNATATQAQLNQMSQWNKLQNAGYDNSQINTLWNDLGPKSTRTQQNYAEGVYNKVFGKQSTESVTQLNKDKTALATQRQGMESGGYEGGIEANTSAINTLNRTLNNLLKDTHTGGLLGWLGGITAHGSGGAAGNTAGTMGGGTSSSTSIVSGAAKSAITAAESQKGVPYVYGGETPGKGFDCSGLVQWAYEQAGVKLPRTSYQMWSSLEKKSIPLDKVQAGDLIFTAGSDGTATSPGHVAMMVSGNQLIQAEETGTRIGIFPYNPSGWQHAARVSGSLATGGGGGGSPSGSTNGGTGTPGGTSALITGVASGMTDADLSSGSESDALSSGGGGLLSGMLGNTGYAGTGASGTGSGGSSNGGGSSTAGGSTVTNLTGTAGQVEAMMKKMAAGSPWKWSGTSWTDLYNVEMREAGFNMNAKNPNSSAYGLAQFINGPSEYAQYGGNSNTMSGQITGFLNYVKERYGNPAAAWAHEQNYGWYARGTQNMAPGVSIVGENGPEAVISTGGQKILTAGQTSGLLAQAASSPAAAGGIVVNIAQGAVVFNGGVGGTGAAPGTPTAGATDIQSAGQALGEQVVAIMKKDAMIQKLAAGVS